MPAAAGDANAALMYALDGSPLLNDSDEMFRDPQGLLTYKQKATRPSIMPFIQPVSIRPC